MFINWLIYDVANNLVKLQLLVVTSSNSSTRLHQSRGTAKDETAWIWPGEIRYPNSGYAMIIAAELRPNIPTCFGMCIYIYIHICIYIYDNIEYVSNCVHIYGSKNNRFSKTTCSLSKEKTLLLRQSIGWEWMVLKQGKIIRRQPPFKWNADLQSQ